MGRPRRIFSKRGIVKPPYNPLLEKYYHNRRNIFSKFDRGIWIDAEGWFSVTPERVAAATSQFMSAGAQGQLFVDAFVGVGGNAIQQALNDPRGIIIAVDIDPHKIELARHNAAIYGVAHRIQFIIGDFLQLAPRLRADLCFLSPPWGGFIDYANDFSLATLGAAQSGLDGFSLLDIAASVAPCIGYYLPIQTKETELLMLADQRDDYHCDLVHLYWGRSRKQKARAILVCFRKKSSKEPVVEQDASKLDLVRPSHHQQLNRLVCHC